MEMKTERISQATEQQHLSILLKAIQPIPVRAIEPDFNCTLH